MNTQTPLAILETMMAARETYRANLTTLGYTRVVANRYESSWTAWVHPNYIQMVEGLNNEYYNIDMENLEEAVGHALPEDSINKGCLNKGLTCGIQYRTSQTLN